MAKVIIGSTPKPHILFSNFFLIVFCLFLQLLFNASLPLFGIPKYYTSMQKLESLLTEGQLSALRGQLWWVADRDHPFLAKFVLHDDVALIQVTDMKYLWVGRFSMAVLLQDKQKYAKTLQMKQPRDLLLLFESLLSASDPESNYVFTELKEGGISFTIRKRIHFYDFSWTLKLTKTCCNPVELICRELMGPLYAALQAQGRRVEMLKKKFELVEKDYIRKMSEMEKGLYKSPLIEDSEDWRLLLPKQEGRLLAFTKWDHAGEFFMKMHLGDGQRNEKQKEKEREVAVFEDQRKNKAIAKVMSSEVFEMGEHQLNRQLQRERIKLKKEKKIDFL